jgi:exopolysaccharide production protein ExoZ
MASERLEPIQALRAIAALMVVAHHAITIAHAGSGLPRPLIVGAASLDEFGCAGVDVFFVISGFIMARSLERRDGSPDARTFLRRRVIRIAPPFWIATILMIGWEAGAHRTSFSPASLLNGLTIVPISDVETFSRNAAPLFLSWTLAYELCFYAIIAAALWLKPGKALLASMAFMLAGATLGLVYNPLWSPGAFVANPIGLEFEMGMVAWLLCRSDKVQEIAPTLCMLGAVLFAASLTVAGYPDFNPSPQSVMAGRTGLVRAIGWGMPAFLLVLGAAAGRTSASGPFLRGLAHVGDASYAIYLLHPVVLVVLHDLGLATRIGSPAAFVLLVLLASIAAGLLFTRWMERPLFGWLDRSDGKRAPERGRQRACGLGPSPA